MGVERMNCCGALTKVYGDAGNRRHKPGCKTLIPKPKVKYVLADNMYLFPVPDGWEIDGWKCLYHNYVCHNGLDCDLVPRMVPTRDHARAAGVRLSRPDQAELDAALKEL